MIDKNYVAGAKAWIKQREISILSSEATIQHYEDEIYLMKQAIKYNKMQRAADIRSIKRQQGILDKYIADNS